MIDHNPESNVQQAVPFFMVSDAPEESEYSEDESSSA
jgi:hypothetical protein